MKCNECRKKIHRMIDGDLGARETQETCAHMKGCEGCSSYYKEMKLICSALGEPDREPPAGFRARWKESLRRQTASKRAKRSPAFIPVIACSICAIFLLSTVLISPQVFGLSGWNTKSGGAHVKEMGAQPAPTVQATSGPVFFSLDPGTEAQTAASTVPSPQTRTAEYSGEAPVAAATATGVIGGEEETAGRSEEAVALSDGTASDASVQTVAMGAQQTPVPLEEAFVLAVENREDAIALEEAAKKQTDVFTVLHEMRDNEEVLQITGTPEELFQILTLYEYEVPQGTCSVHIVWTSAGPDESASPMPGDSQSPGHYEPNSSVAPSAEK